MNVMLDRTSEKELLELAREIGKAPAEVLRELVHEAAVSRKTNGNVKAASALTDPAYEPSRTELGRKLRDLSRKHVEGGGKLLTVDEINREVAENRGER
jgi:hypothetical protein